MSQAFIYIYIYTVDFKKVVSSPMRRRCEPGSKKRALFYNVSSAA